GPSSLRKYPLHRPEGLDVRLSPLAAIGTSATRDEGSVSGRPSYRTRRRWPSQLSLCRQRRMSPHTKALDVRVWELREGAVRPSSTDAGGYPSSAAAARFPRRPQEVQTSAFRRQRRARSRTRRG